VTETTTYIQYEDGVAELTDLSEDPEERYNLAEKRETECRAHQSELLQHLLSTQSDCPEQISNA